jgi:hypothetical protein
LIDLWAELAILVISFTDFAEQKLNIELKAMRQA